MTASTQLATPKEVPTLAKAVREALEAAERAEARAARMVRTVKGGRHV